MILSKAAEKHKAVKYLSTKPWFVASILITLFLIGILIWNLVFSYYMLSSFKDKELAIERASWKLLFYAESMQMSARISASSGNLMWKKKYVQTKQRLNEVTEHIPKLISSAEVAQRTKQIRVYLQKINRIEDRVFELVGRGDKDKALKLLAGWKYTNNQKQFSESARELAEFIQKRIARRTANQKTRTLVFLFLVAGCLLALLVLWTITIKIWRMQNKKKEAAEEELVQSNIKLQEATDKANKLAQEASETAQRLRELDEIKSRLLSSVSHELRTPLTSILGFAKMIYKDFEKFFHPLAVNDSKLEKKADRIAENCQVISQEGDRLTRLINDVLDLSKIESGRMEWRDYLLKAEEVLKSAVDAMRGAVEFNDEIELELHLEEGLPAFKADRDRILQVLVNLLSNAYKFTQRGKITAAAELVEYGSGKRQYIRFSVADTGSGIPEDQQRSVFEYFHQVAGEDTLVDKPKGTGLGLPICKQIVEHYGGRIWVESEQGEGSVFYFILPANVDAVRSY